MTEFRYKEIGGFGHIATLQLPSTGDWAPPKTLSFVDQALKVVSTLDGIRVFELVENDDE